MKQSMKLLSLMLLVSATAFGSSYRSDECCNRRDSASIEPLFCNGFNLQFHGGVSPIIWANRGCMDFINSATIVSCASACSVVSNVCPSNVSNNCSGVACVSPVCVSSLTCSDVCGTAIARVAIPKFNKLFETPWTIGATMGYAISSNHEVYAEFNYVQAANKPEYFTTNVTNAAGAAVLLQTNLVAKYKNASAYAGYRYNFDRRSCFPVCWLGDVSWFVGLKAGLLHHFGVRGFINSSFTTDIVDGDTTRFFDVFKSNTTFSGAGEVGMDICLNQDWSMMIGAEVAANWGPSCGAFPITVTELANNTIKTAKVGAEILFPVTFGLRYKF